MYKWNYIFLFIFFDSTSNVSFVEYILLTSIKYIILSWILQNLILEYSSMVWFQFKIAIFTQITC